MKEKFFINQHGSRCKFSNCSWKLYHTIKSFSLEIQMKRILSLSHPAQMAKESFIRQFSYDITLNEIEPMRSKWNKTLKSY